MGAVSKNQVCISSASKKGVLSCGVLRTRVSPLQEIAGGAGSIYEIDAWVLALSGTTIAVPGKD
jgi:hypothetical protein